MYAFPADPSPTSSAFNHLAGANLLVFVACACEVLPFTVREKTSSIILGSNQVLRISQELILERKETLS